MAHGVGSGFAILYDGEGNPVRVRIVAPDEYAVTVRNERLEQLVELMKLQTKVSQGILLQLAEMTGSDAGLDELED